MRLVEGFGDEGRRLYQAIDGRTRGTLPTRLQLRSLMVSGRSGIGKSLLLNTIAQHLQCIVIRIHLGRTIAAGNQHHGLKQQLSRVPTDKPTIVCFVDAELFRGLYGNIVAKFCRDIEDFPQCLVVMTTRNPHKVVPALRHQCDDHIRLLPPGRFERLQLARWYVCGKLAESTLEDIADRAHGKIAAELFAILNTHISSRPYLSKAKPALPAVVRWEDIGGLDEIIDELKESIVWPLQYREQFKRLGIRAPRGVLLHGPPGTGKTMLAKAAATEVAANFISVAIPDLIKGEVGESEKSLAAVFETAKRSPSILFLDEIEAIFGSREHAGETGKKLISQLFLEMDSIPEDAHMVVLAATNEYRLIDPSILRPGRLDKIMHIPRPNEQSRLDILRRSTRHLTLEDRDKLLIWLATEAELSGAEIKSLVRSACYSAIQRESKTLTKQDFEVALRSFTSATADI
ncbi:hypothetical protein H4R20_002411 [Coemansia guatemalensis]|uniref:AAA+ ATPase domain-containing protein n=1 Tax=Coemansia guatemalensis TaxID=2761395 RepID=A0A9W8I022_9FUNG|nr:hypothetical protein H4R20_002411 [Coemansia guatemalensis]